MNKRKIAVIGAGASGMLAAGKLAEAGLDVYLFEKNKLLGKKLGITGKGRCNVTNNCSADEVIKSVTTNGRFLFSAVNRFTPQDTIDFFTSRGVPLKTERGNRVFPESDKATDVVLALKGYALSSGVRIINENVTSLLVKDGRVERVDTDRSKYSDFESVLVCTGGKSYPGTGSTGDGYRFAEAAGHTIITPTPSLVGLDSEDKLCRDAQGLALKNTAISVLDTQKNKVIYEDFGEMLFTHFGLSGPMILSASAHTRPMEKGRYKILIDLKPALSAEMLDARILSDFEKYKNKNFENALGDLLPQKLIRPIINILGIGYDRKVNGITRAEREKIVTLLKALPVTIRGLRPIDEAIITSGGVKTSEIDPRTMRSKLCENLYFAGEVIDVDAYTGGFNLQIAFSTAVTAAEAMIFGE